MTKRNLVVKNGLQVGDVIISATDNTIVGLSVSAPSNPGDVVTKSYSDSGTQTFTNKTFDANGTGNSISNIETADFASAAFKDEDTMSSDSATAVASQQSIKAYVDSKLNTDSTITADSGATTAVVSGSGASGTFTVTANSNTELTVNDDGVVIYGNLTVQGTETIVSSQNLQVEDAIIGLNSNVSDKNNMPRFSGLHLHRGTGSAALDQDLYWVWDDAFADDGTSIHGNAGGAFTAMRSTHEEGSEVPNTDFALVDMRCNVLHATATAAQYADVAERFEADAPMSAGAVVELGGSAEITESTADMSTRVFGVISSQPAYAMNAAAGNSDSHPFVAMTGRTPVRVIGPVAKGQRLVSSSTKGTARAINDSDITSSLQIIGRALEDKHSTDIGLVNCVVRTNN